MPPKKTGKDAKEVEAQQKEEERKVLQNKLREENQKFGITQIFPGLETLISSYMIENVWDHDDPVFHMKECMYYQLERLRINDKFKMVEQETIANQMVYSMIFAKNDASMDSFKTAIVCNLIWSLFKNDDTRYQNLEIPFWSETMLAKIDEIENLEEWIEEKTPKRFRVMMPNPDDVLADEGDDIDIPGSRANKTKDGDMSKFKSFIKELTSNSNLPDTVSFKKEEIMKIIEHVFKNYFEKYELFSYSVSYDRAEEDIFMKITIDTPQYVPSLSDSNFLGKIIQDDERQRMEEEMRLARIEKEQIEEEIRIQREAKQRAEDERWAGLDEKTIQMIKDRVSETREFMEKELETKKEEFAEKIENAKNTKGKKK